MSVGMGEKPRIRRGKTRIDGSSTILFVENDSHIAVSLINGIPDKNYHELHTADAGNICGGLAPCSLSLSCGHIIAAG